MVSVRLRRKLTWTPVLSALFAALLVLTGCGSQPELQAPPTGTTSGFEFAVNPQTEQVTLTETTEATGKTAVQPQAIPSDSLTLVPGTDLALRNLSSEFASKTKLIVRVQFENITADSDFAQPFFFTLSSESKNFVRANTPLVTNAQLGGDGVLSPGETSQRFQFEVSFKEGQPFTFLVEANAVVPNDTNLSPVCTNPVAIPDEILEDAIREKLGKSSGNLTCADLESLTSLREDGFIGNFEGLQYAVNLTFLNVRISDLSPLRTLTNLKQLYLYTSYISDLSPLQNLTGLEKLYLQFNRISDLSPLENLTNLKELDLSGNPVYDFAPLQNLTKLTYLKLEDTGISDLSVLVNNSGLGSGDRVLLKSNILSPQAVADIETLEARGVEVEFNAPTGCTDPVIIADKGLELGIRGYFDKPTGDLTCADMESLLELIRGFSSIASLEGLQYAVKLKVLRLGTNDISDLSPLQNLTNLTNLDLRNNNISDISALVANSGLSSGDFIRLEDNPLSPQALDDIATLIARGVDVTF